MLGVRVDLITEAVGLPAFLCDLHTRSGCTEYLPLLVFQPDADSSVVF
jgi:hypothetical protein